jgi:hypothetical protein
MLLNLQIGYLPAPSQETMWGAMGVLKGDEFLNKPAIPATTKVACGKNLIFRSSGCGSG